MVEETKAVTSRAFSAYGHPLDIVPSFKYLGIVILMTYDDCQAVVQNLSKVWTVWWKLERILSREGARLSLSGFFFKAVIQ